MCGKLAPISVDVSLSRAEVRLACAAPDADPESCGSSVVFLRYSKVRAGGQRERGSHTYSGRHSTKRLEVGACLQRVARIDKIQVAH